LPKISPVPNNANPANKASQLEREALHRLPDILENLLGERPEDVDRPAQLDRGYDALVESRHRRWVVQIKSSSNPGVVARAAEQLDRASTYGLPLLLVPFMTSAGAKAAADRQLNWIDLSGNAYIRDHDLYVSVQGRPNRFPARGRPSSAFAPKSSRVARALLLDPARWWRQKDLSEQTDLDPSRVSRVVRRLEDDDLLARTGQTVRPRDPNTLLDAWAGEYRFDRHDIVTGHVTGSGVELTRELHDTLERADVRHAFTGLPAAWALERFARFRLTSVYVLGDPRDAADAIEMRRNERGANVQLIGPDDRGVFDGQRDIDELPCVAPVQVYLDLLALPERAREAAEELRHSGELWDARR
jgi:DNA-binding Lrp family transcriptional regulator